MIICGPTVEKAVELRISTFRRRSSRSPALVHPVPSPGSTFAKLGLGSQSNRSESDSFVIRFARPWGCWCLLVERLPVDHTPFHELGPLRYYRDWVCFFR